MHTGVRVPAGPPKRKHGFDTMYQAFLIAIIPIIFENIIAYIIAKYFRNALVRANYTNVEKGIYETTRYIELFLKNLIFNGNYELKNRYLHIRWNEKEDIE